MGLLDQNSFMGGILGSPSKTALLFAGLRDILANAQGRESPGYMQQMMPLVERMDAKKKYQDMVAQQFAAPKEIPGGPATMLKPSFATGTDASGMPSLNTTFNSVAAPPRMDQGGSLRQLYGPQADAMQGMAMAMDPGPGMSFLANGMGQAQQRDWQQQDQKAQWDREDARLAMEPPKTRQIESGNNILNQEWDPATKTYKTVSTAPRWQPQTPQPRAPIIVSPGATVLDPNTGKPIYTAPSQAKPQELTQDQTKSRQLFDVAASDLPNAEKYFGSITSFGNQVGRGIGKTANLFSNVLTLGNADIANPEAMTGPEAKTAMNAIDNIITSYNYSVSGAQAGPAEIAEKRKLVIPDAWDSEEVKAQKRARLRSWVQTIGERGGYTPAEINRALGPDPSAQNGSSGGRGGMRRYNPATGKIE